jgi:hypothetical protein
MTNLFSRTPKTIRTATWLVLLLPPLMCVWGFRLFRHPNNPDAWIVLAGWELAHLVPAYFILKGSNAMRWLWTAWVVFKMATGYWVFAKIWNSPYLDILFQLCIGMGMHLATVVFLFLPTSHSFFARDGKPNQALQRNAGSRPSSNDPSASETPSSLGPRG